MGSRDSPLLIEIPHLQPVHSFSISANDIRYCMFSFTLAACLVLLPSIQRFSAYYVRTGGGDDVPECASRISEDISTLRARDRTHVCACSPYYRTHLRM